MTTTFLTVVSKVICFICLLMAFDCGAVSKIPERAVSEFAYPVTYVESRYRDVELTKLWSSLSNINNPSLEDYLKIENYLQYGRRPYLDLLFNKAISNGWISAQTLDRSVSLASRVLQRLKFVSSRGEMPVQKVLALGGVSLEDRSRCIIMYASYNFDASFGKKLYTTKMYDIIRDLEEEGYQGHVMFRIGGYPMIAQGGLHLAHVPYSFKILALIEASMMGYKDVLWLDTAVHPTNDLSKVFLTIKNDGFYLLKSGINVDYDYNYGIIPDETVKSCGLAIGDLPNIPHIIATIIGISFRNCSQHDLLHEWYRLTAETKPAMSLYPEEFLVSVAAWRTHKKATDHVGYAMNVRSQTPIKPTKANKPFWHDKG